MASTGMQHTAAGPVTLEGFYDKPPKARPVVTGSRATGAVALASLLTALQELGLITDSSSA